MNGILGAWVFYYSSIFLIVSVSFPPARNFIRSLARATHFLFTYALCVYSVLHTYVWYRILSATHKVPFLLDFFSHSSSSGCDSPQILLLSSIRTSVTVFLSGWVTLGAVRHLLSHFRKLIKSEWKSWRHAVLEIKFRRCIRNWRHSQSRQLPFRIIVVRWYAPISTTPSIDVCK